MKEFHLAFHEDELIERYIKEIFVLTDTPFEAENKFGLTEMTFFCSEDLRKKLIGGVILNFYKLKELMKRLPYTDSRAYFALMGALIGLEQEEDLSAIYEGLEKNEVLNLDGFYNFCLNELRENWKNLAELSAKLYAQCNGEADVFALSVFMMGMDDNFDSTVVVDGEKLKWEKSGINISIVPYFGVKDGDFIATLLSQRPTDVVVLNPEKVSENILSVIKAIGE